jgi:hypothetical protein
MRFPRSPDHADNPTERGEYHIHDGAQHENLERTEPVAEAVKNHAERAIARAENEPSKEARGQEMPWQAQKAKNGNGSQKAEDRGRRDIALQRETIQERRMIRDHQPRGENQSQANAHINTRANCRVAEDVEPTITGQMRTYQHAVLGSQETSNCLTRFYGDGCVTSTATGAHGGLSFPARSTAVTVYQ